METGDYITSLQRQQQANLWTTQQLQGTGSSNGRDQ